MSAYISKKSHYMCHNSLIANMYLLVSPDSGAFGQTNKPNIAMIAHCHIAMSHQWSKSVSKNTHFKIEIPNVFYLFKF